MIKRIWALLTRGRLVWLRYRDGEVTLSIARADPWGNLTAELWWPYSIRTVRLLDGGRVDGGYVKEWKDA